MSKVPPELFASQRPIRLLATYPTLEDYELRCVAVARDIRVACGISPEAPSHHHLRLAMLAVDTVDYLIANEWCLCLRCVQAYAEDTLALEYGMRSEVRQRTGRACIQHVHKEPRNTRV